MIPDHIIIAVRLIDHSSNNIFSKTYEKLRCDESKLTFEKKSDWIYPLADVVDPQIKNKYSFINSIRLNAEFALESAQNSLNPPTSMSDVRAMVVEAVAIDYLKIDPFCSELNQADKVSMQKEKFYFEALSNKLDIQERKDRIEMDRARSPTETRICSPREPNIRLIEPD